MISSHPEVFFILEFRQRITQAAAAKSPSWPAGGKPNFGQNRK